MFKFLAQRRDRKRAEQEKIAQEKDAKEWTEHWTKEIAASVNSYFSRPPDPHAMFEVIGPHSSPEATRVAETLLPSIVAFGQKQNLNMPSAVRSYFLVEANYQRAMQMLQRERMGSLTGR